MDLKKELSLEDICNEFANYFKDQLAYKRKSIVLTEQNKRCIKILIAYFFERNELSSLGDFNHDKGIFLFGPVGTGKSTLFEIICDWIILKKKNQPFRIVSCRDIQWEYTKNGYDTILLYGKNSYVYDYFKGFQKNKPIAFVFDDFGSENKLKHFGNQASIMEELLQDRYVQFCNTGMKTHITSNMGKDWNKIEEIYGTRFRSRCREMFNIIELDGCDLRK